GSRVPTESDETAPDHTALIAALNRASDESRDLRLQMTELTRLLRSLEGSAESRTILPRQPAELGESLGASPVERQAVSAMTLRTRVIEPDDDKRKRLDEFAGQSPEQQTTRARAH